MASLKNFFEKHGKIIGALVLLLGVGLLALDCVLFMVRPMVQAQPGLRRILILNILLILGLLGGAGVMAFRLFRHPDSGKKSLVRWGVTAVAVFALLYAFVLPPLSSPDEIRHYLGAYRLSNQWMNAKDQVEKDGFVYVRAEDAELILHDFPGYDDYYSLLEKKNWLGTTDKTELTLMTAEKYQSGVFYSYLPQAVGITLARLLHMKQIPLMLLGRLFSIALFVLLLALALKKMPFGREMLLLLGLTPMVLEVVAAYSYDGLVLGLSFYFIAHVLQLTYEAEKVTIRDMIILTAVMALMAPVKVIYLLLAFIMFMIPREKFASKKQYLLSALAMLVVVGLFFLLTRAGKLSEYVAETNTELTYAEEGSFTLSAVLGHPVHTAKLFLNSIQTQSGTWLTDMVGSRLGWQDISLPGLLVFLWLGLLFVASMRPAEEGVFVKTGHRVLLWAVFIVIGMMAMVTMMLAATPISATYVWGMQGRYFLPILPLSILAVRGTSLRRREDSSAWLVYGAVLLEIWAVCSIMGEVMLRLGEMKMLSAW